MLELNALVATRTGTEAEDLANKLRNRVVGQASGAWRAFSRSMWIKTMWIKRLWLWLVAPRLMRELEGLAKRQPADWILEVLTKRQPVDWMRQTYRG